MDYIGEQQQYIKVGLAYRQGANGFKMIDLY
jgi:hypothetical protein